MGKSLDHGDLFHFWPKPSSEWLINEEEGKFEINPYSLTICTFISRTLNRNIVILLHWSL